jgi:hypothetical protein
MGSAGSSYSLTCRLLIRWPGNMRPQNGKSVAPVVWFFRLDKSPVTRAKQELLLLWWTTHAKSSGISNLDPGAVRMRHRALRPGIPILWEVLSPLNSSRLPTQVARGN